MAKIRGKGKDISVQTREKGKVLLLRVFFLNSLNCSACEMRRVKMFHVKHFKGPGSVPRMLTRGDDTSRLVKKRCRKCLPTRGFLFFRPNGRACAASLVLVPTDPLWLIVIEIHTSQFLERFQNLGILHRFRNGDGFAAHSKPHSSAAG